MAILCGDAPSGAGPAAGGIALFRKGEFTAAAEALEQAAALDPRDKEVRLYLARCRFELREYDRALRDIETLLAGNRAHAEARYWLAMTHLELGSARLEKMAAIAPGSYRVHQLNGELQEQKTRYRDAIDSYKRALALAPELAGLRYAVGNVYWKMLQHEEAAEWFKQELARNPDHALSNYRLGSIYVSRQKAGLAIPHLKRAIATDPRLVGVHLELGRAFALERRLDRAVAADPENDAVHSLLARLYQQLGKKAEADGAATVPGPESKAAGESTTWGASGSRSRTSKPPRVWIRASPTPCITSESCCARRSGTPRRCAAFALPWSAIPITWIPNWASRGRCWPRAGTRRDSRRCCVRRRSTRPTRSRTCCWPRPTAAGGKSKRPRRRCANSPS